MIYYPPTPMLTSQEIADRHVAAPAISASHILRIISSDKQERLQVAENLKIPQPHSADRPLQGMSDSDKAQFLKDVHDAVYGCILGAFVQGLEIITKASKTQVSLRLRLELILRNGMSRCMTVF